MNKKIAKNLLEIGAVCLEPNNPFTWASGIKSPIYCDNRLTLSYPDTRNLIKNELAKMIESIFPEADIIAGTATAGIPHAALVADYLELPMVYVRSSAKEHGKGNQIEGKVVQGQKVVLVEDLLSTGGSSIKCVKALRDAGCTVLGIISIFSYQLPILEENLSGNNIEAFSLCNYTTLLEVAIRDGHIEQKELEKLSNWRKNPTSIDWMK
ncbi:MAG: orotate phosphoribosyltransferase [Bacillales bacterium]|jgi:orotate phosphoribosyltransferase|nr:orotate phosphoribosyltransferase [Bacillales bacterium]